MKSPPSWMRQQNRLMTALRKPVYKGVNKKWPTRRILSVLLGICILWSLASRIFWNKQVIETSHRVQVRNTINAATNAKASKILFFGNPASEILELLAASLIVNQEGLTRNRMLDAMSVLRTSKQDLSIRSERILRNRSPASPKSPGRQGLPVWMKNLLASSESGTTKDAAENLIIHERVSIVPFEYNVQDLMATLLRYPDTVCVLSASNLRDDAVALEQTLAKYNMDISLQEWAWLLSTWLAKVLRVCSNHASLVTTVSDNHLMQSTVEWYDNVSILFDALNVPFSADLQSLLQSEINKIRSINVADEAHNLLNTFVLDAALIDKTIDDERGIASKNFHDWVGNRKSGKRVESDYATVVLGGTDSVLEQWPELKYVETQAYATLLTSDSIDYINGALILGKSIRIFDASRDLVAMVTEDVLPSSESRLTTGGWRVVRVPRLPEPWFGGTKCPYVVKRNMNQEVRWGRMWSKLGLWNLEYERVLYFDADTFVVGPVQTLISGSLWSDGSQVPDVIGEGGTGHKYVNAGVLLVHPSTEVYQYLLSYGEQNPPPRLFSNLVDCTEQAMVNVAFSQRVSLPSLKGTEIPEDEAVRNPTRQTERQAMRLSSLTAAVLETSPETSIAIGRPDVKRDYSKNAPFAVHFIRRDRCLKPWSMLDGSSKALHKPYTRKGVLNVLKSRVCDPVPYMLFLALADKHRIGSQPLVTE